MQIPGEANMLFRLYFLLPDTDLTLKVIDELTENGVSPSRIYAHCRNPLHITKLPRASLRQRLDVLRRIEYVLWRADLLIFFVAMAVFVTTIFTGMILWSLLALLVMAVSFFAGDLFAAHVPNVHLQEFNDALAHNEVLLMVDVEHKQIARIESLVEHHHPAAVAGGSSWTLGLKGI